MFGRRAEARSGRRVVTRASLLRRRLARLTVVAAVVLSSLVGLAACAAWPLSYRRTGRLNVERLDPEAKSRSSTVLACSAGRLFFDYSSARYNVSDPWYTKAFHGRRTRLTSESGRASAAQWDLGISAKPLDDPRGGFRATQYRALGVEVCPYAYAVGWDMRGPGLRGLNVTVPLYLLVLLSCVLPGLYLRRRRRARARARRVSAGQCGACGYNLHGIPGGRCPECGQDPALRHSPIVPALS